MAAVEIFEEEFGTWHEGSLVSLEADGAVVRYKDDWTAQEKLPLSRVRAAAPPTPNPFRPKVGERVEVRTHTNDGAPQSWWLATITKLKAEFVYVHYEGWSDSFDEIVDLSRVRPPNPSPAMSAATFTTAKAVVPESIAEWCANSDNHTEFCQQSKLFSVHMDNDNKHLVLQGTKDNVELAMALIDVHFKRLMDRKRLHDFKTRSQSRMEEGKNSILKKVLDIPPELIGLAIGKGGANFIKARAVPGVLSVEIINEEGYDRVRVVANSQAAIDAATDIIYFTQEQLQVPRKHASRLIGTQGTNLLDIVSKSNCIRITVQPTHGNEPVATLNLVGSQKAIQLAKVLIHAHLQLFEERDSIEEEFRSVHSKLSELGLEPSAGRGMRSDAGMGRGGYRSPRGQPSDRRAYGRGDDYGAGSGRGGSSSGGSGGYAGRGGRGGGQARGRGGYGGGAGRGNNNGDSGAAGEGAPGTRQITLFTDGTVRVKMPSGGERADEAADDVVQPRRRQNRGGEAASASAAAVTPSNAARQEPKPRGAAKAPATAPATPAQPQQQQQQQQQQSQQQSQQSQQQQPQQSQQSQSARRAKPAAEGSNANANANNASGGKGGAQAAPASAPASAARPQGSGRPARGANAEGGAAAAGGAGGKAAGSAAAPATAAAANGNNSNSNSNSQVKEQRAPRGKPAAAAAAAAAGGSAAAPAATNGHANTAAAASAPAAATPATTAS